jgi:Protein of unknown function (DUF2480)
MQPDFVNKVEESGIITLNLEELMVKEEPAVFDLKDYLFMGLILKEKDFREALKSLDTSVYENKYVAITCSADAIIPMWAYMLVASYLQPVVKDIYFGTKEDFEKDLLLKEIQKVNAEDYTDKRVVIKGCGEKPIAESAYIAITQKLRPAAKSIMYGEPCSTVPIYKKPKQQ